MNNKIRIHLAVFCLSLLSSASAKASNIQLRYLKEPRAAVIDGQNHFVYELVIDNHEDHEISVEELQIDAQTLGPVRLNKKDLAPRIRLLGTVNLENVQDWLNPRPTPSPLPSGAIPAGRSAVVFLQFEADIKTVVPAAIQHQLQIASGQNQERLNLSVPIEKTAVLVLGSPFAGGTWFPFNGPQDTSPHRRSVLRFHDQFFIAQRFAIDWMLIGDEGTVLKAQTSSKENSSYIGYGLPVLAVADAIVEKITDDIPENIPDTGSRAVIINGKTVTGNSLILKLSKNLYALYAHLQPGSISVKPGDQVKKGQVLGRLGNSGNSTAPHLHFHVCDGPSALECQGVPYVFETFKHVETKIEGDEIVNLKMTGVGPWLEVFQEFIWNNRLIAFPSR